jgi:hypothetical protein
LQQRLEQVGGGLTCANAETGGALVKLRVNLPHSS